VKNPAPSIQLIEPYYLRFEMLAACPLPAKFTIGIPGIRVNGESCEGRPKPKFQF
jgi:hypothetical protein